MVDFDPLNSVTPAQPVTINTHAKPTIAALKAAIKASPQAASYPDSFLLTATKNDLKYICRTHNIAVAGL